MLPSPSRVNRSFGPQGRVWDQEVQPFSAAGPRSELVSGIAAGPEVLGLGNHRLYLEGLITCPSEEFRVYIPY